MFYSGLYKEEHKSIIFTFRSRIQLVQDAPPRLNGIIFPLAPDYWTSNPATWRILHTHTYFIPAKPIMFFLLLFIYVHTNIFSIFLNFVILYIKIFLNPLSFENVETTLSQIHPLQTDHQIATSFNTAFSILASLSKCVGHRNDYRAVTIQCCNIIV